jgi:hypothetical protein
MLLAQQGDNAVRSEDQLDDLCDALGLALEINYLRGYVMVGHKRFDSVDGALNYVKRRAQALRGIR